MRLIQLKSKVISKEFPEPQEAPQLEITFLINRHTTCFHNEFAIEINAKDFEEVPQRVSPMKDPETLLPRIKFDLVDNSPLMNRVGALTQIRHNGIIRKRFIIRLEAI